MSELPHPPKLLDQVRAALRRKHYALRTEEAYVGWIRRFILFHGTRHPRELGAAEVSAFSTHLAVEREVAASTQNQALSALLFLYGEVLLQPLSEDLRITYAKRPTYLPTVLSREEAWCNWVGNPGFKMDCDIHCYSSTVVFCQFQRIVLGLMGSNRMIARR